MRKELVFWAVCAQPAVRHLLDPKENCPSPSEAFFFQAGVNFHGAASATNPAKHE